MNRSRRKQTSGCSPDATVALIFEGTFRASIDLTGDDPVLIACLMPQRVAKDIEVYLPSVNLKGNGKVHFVLKDGVRDVQLDSIGLELRMTKLPKKKVGRA